LKIFDRLAGTKMSDECKQVRASFYQSMSASTIIHAIERVENGELWMKYVR